MRYSRHSYLRDASALTDIFIGCVQASHRRWQFTEEMSLGLDSVNPAPTPIGGAPMAAAVTEAISAAYMAA